MLKKIGEDNSSGLYEASGLKEAFEKIDREMEEEKEKKEISFWTDIENEKDIFDEPKEVIKKEEPKKEVQEDDIDPFWLT